jgi:hypothetical protein
MIENENLILCPSCGTTIDPRFARCPSCNFAIGTSAGLDPVGSIHDEGRMWVKATEVKRPKPIVVIGVWLIFLPMLVGSAAVALNILTEGSGSGAAQFVFFWIGVGLSILSLVFLIKMTGNYLRKD